MKLDPDAVMTMLPPSGFLRMWWMPSLTVYKQPIKLTSTVFRFGGSKSPLESTSSSSSEIVGAIPALAKTWLILPYFFSAALNLQEVSESRSQSRFVRIAKLTVQAAVSNLLHRLSRKAPSLPQALEVD